MDTNNRILQWIDQVCREKKFDQKLLHRDSPIKQIQKEYLRMLDNQNDKISFHAFVDNNNKKNSKKQKERKEKNNEIFFKSVFGEFIEDIQKKYSEDIWKIKSYLRIIKGDNKNERERN